jgi:hypothetical protein
VIAELNESLWTVARAPGDPTRREARPADRDLWFCNLIEPNARGAGGVRAAFWSALDGA